MQNLLFLCIASVKTAILIILKKQPCIVTSLFHSSSLKEEVLSVKRYRNSLLVVIICEGKSRVVFRRAIRP